MQDKSTEHYKAKVQSTVDEMTHYRDNLKAYFSYKQYCKNVFRLLELWKNRKK